MAALKYSPDGYCSTGPKLMGRNVAGESFFRGLLAYGKCAAFWAQVDPGEDGLAFAEAVRAGGRAEPIHIVDHRTLAAVSQAGVVFHPGPGIAEHAWQRTAHDPYAWSLCGVTHTTASARVMDAMVDWITAPVQPWDAVICTSHAVKANVDFLLQAQVDHLKERLGITRLVLPQRPVIPLGVHTQDFVFSDEQRSEARAALGVTPGTVVVLFMGRLSFHAKAHPLAMYQALEAAAVAAGKDVLLVECGWHANAFIEKAYADAARVACPHVRVVTLDGRKPEDRTTAWASADLFCSLSDNIQETFGLTPVEAMAAGLPVVVSDWDGYRETVRDGVDGFRVPTLMPQAGLGGDLAQRHALSIDTYDMYCGHTCSLVAVDIAATTEAFTRLFASESLRRQMGAAGRERARTVYDWSVIIPQYEALWAEQNRIREAEKGKLKPLAQPWPARPDPFASFAAYPTEALTPQTRLGLRNAGQTPDRVKQLRSLAMVSFAHTVLPTDEEVAQVLAAAAPGPQPAIDLVASIPEPRRAFVFRSLAWLVKLGVLAVQR